MQRLISVEKYTGEGPNYNLYSFEKLFWKGPLLTNRIFHTKEGWPQYCKQFDYDPRGNVQRETLWGNLSGYNDKPIAYPGDGFPEYNGCEFEFKLYTYTDNGLNLMTSLTEGKTAKTTFEYVDGTDLLAKKLAGPIGSTNLREFFEYDCNGTLIRHVRDDGDSGDISSLSHVTERHITVTVPTTTKPIGLPAIIEKKYLDLTSGEECLQQKIIYTYTPEGWPATKEVYDANGVFAFCERWEYDAIGNNIFYQDPLGHITTKKYDANNNLIYEQGPSSEFHREYTYDYSNRLIKSDTVCEGGSRLSERNYYDLCSNKVATEDIYNNRTEYFYDEFGRLTKTSLPLVFNEDGSSTRPETTTVYNELSFPHIETDARGFATSKRYTIKGKPYDITYSDGSSEALAYNVDGTIQKHMHANSTYTLYEYDYQKRETKKETYSNDGTLLDAIYKEYSGFRILRENTLGGIKTEYRHDDAGRLVEVTQGDSRTAYQYDSMGRRTKTLTYYGPGKGDYSAQIEVLDNLERLVEKREEDSSGKILKKSEYEYDSVGNCIKTIDHVQNGVSVFTRRYDPFGQEIESIDPLGNVTRTSYEYSHQNEYGQMVAHQVITDPLGCKTTITKDALGRVAFISKQSIVGNRIQKTQISYDANGNKVRQTDRVFSIHVPMRDVTTLWQYDSCNRLTATIEAAGTSEQKQTAITYNLFGQKEHLIKADGMKLSHTYDLLGRLSTIKSSDGMIDLFYTYDANGNAIQVDDFAKGITTYRQYDANNRLAQEILGNGAILSYTYDTMGRPLTTTLPDSSSVNYLYDSTRLQTVHRMNARGNIAYTHTYSEYAPGGLLLNEKYAGNVGEGNYTYDVLGRVESYECDHLHESIEGYDKGGNILARTLDDPVDTTSCKYTYDALSQIEKESGVAQNIYHHDTLNNRVVKNRKVHQINGLNQLLFDGFSTYVYDPNGNLIEKQSAQETVQYAYDAFDRLITVTKANSQYRYSYDELNRRLGKTAFRRNDGAHTWEEVSHLDYVYHGQNEVGTIDAHGILQEYRVLGVGKGAEIGATVLIETGGRAYVPLHDHGGNIACLVGADDGQVVQTYRYSVFGEEQIYDEGGESAVEAISPWRFSSKRVDEETSFVCFGRRYYQPETGRWVSADPLGFEGGPNLYAYVMNNPLTHYDLYGLFSISGGLSSYMPASLGRCINTGKELLQKGLLLPGHAIERIGFHLIPVPGIQCAVRAVGTMMQGKSLRGFETWSDVRSCFDDLGLPEKDPNNKTLLTNGILTTKEELIDMARVASTAIGGYNVHYCYNASHGLVADLLECGMQKFGCGSHSADMLAKCCGRLSAGMGSTGILNLYAHSQGGLITSRLKNLLRPGVSDRMAVNTFGSATQIGRKDFAAVNNYVSSRDLVPWTDPLGMIKAHFSSSSNTTILASTYKGFDHSWSNDTYQETFIKLLNNQYEGKQN